MNTAQQLAAGLLTNASTVVAAALLEYAHKHAQVVDATPHKTTFAFADRSRLVYYHVLKSYLAS